MADKLEVVPGPGLVARFGDVEVWAGPQATPLLQSHLVSEAQRVSQAPSGGDQLANALIAVLQRGDPEPQAPFAVVGPGANGLTLFLHGPVQAWDSGRWLAPQPVPGWMVTSIGRPWPLIVLPYGSHPPPQSQQGNPLDLVTGAVPGAGFVLLRPPSAAPQPSGTFQTVGSPQPAQVGQPGQTGLYGPATGGPVGGTPPSWTPTPGAPVGGAPVGGAPVGGAPVGGTAAGGVPLPGGLLGSGPVPGSPVPGSPVTGSPVTGSPVTGSPVTGGPVTGGPVPGSPVGGAAGLGGPASFAQASPVAAPPAPSARTPGLEGGPVDLRGAALSGQPPLRLASNTVSALGDRPEVLGVRCERGHFNHPKVPNCLRCGRPIAAGAPQSNGPRPSVGDLLADDGSVWGLARGCLIGTEPATAPEVQSGAVQPIAMRAGANHSMGPVHAEVQIRGWSAFVVDRGAEGGTWLQGPGSQGWDKLGRNDQRELANGSHVSCGGRVLTYLSAWPA